MITYLLNKIHNQLLYYNAKIRFCIKAKDKEVLKRNELFRDKFHNESCFIIGNGPSLNEQNLSYLSNKFTFTVNEAFNLKQFKDVKSIFHLMIDMAFWKQEDADILECFNKLEEEQISAYFVTISAKEKIESISGIPVKKVYYISRIFDFYEGFNKKIDFTKGVPALNTVVQYAVLLALFMGFKNIYLIGCDCTVYKYAERFEDNKYIDFHAYQISNEEKQKYLEKFPIMEVEEFFCGVANQFKHYRILGQYCNRRGVKLINLTEGGILESIPRENYESLVRMCEGK